MTSAEPLDKTVLELKDVRASYGNIEALKGVSLTVQAGEIIALLGANGAGKSSALKVTTGLLPPTGGSVRFSGRETKGERTERLVKRGLVMVPEGRRIFPALTVKENLLMGAYFRKDKQEIRRDQEWLLDLFPALASRAGQDGGTLSGGEQQMLAIARGLMGRPILLLLDEPSLGLAPKIIRGIFQTIGEINRTRGTAILLVEQNARLALTASARAYIMTTGRITAEGPSKELLENEEVKKAYLGG
ncbi:MAG: ABC transporter ATP-binding protein [Deltaproteobacteria bacterium]|jgi:branched-chain amino acid transport system ATP-binding protein|nr:ABC transporter ATP-binding protein [Deltaproteobacteria bacterium]